MVKEVKRGGEAGQRGCITMIVFEDNGVFRWLSRMKDRRVGCDDHVGWC